MIKVTRKLRVNTHTHTHKLDKNCKLRNLLNVRGEPYASRVALAAVI